MAIIWVEYHLAEVEDWVKGGSVLVDLSDILSVGILHREDDKL